MTLLEAISPTARGLLSTAERFYSCEYTWHHPVYGERKAHTVITGTDADAALKIFQSNNPHLTSAKVDRAN